jgi:3-hydroxyisobutyrate dehydrogenase-like beta-hydroxyacid dehydrogenase
MRVGFVGLGQMGMPMARHVLGAGFELVVHNRTRARAEKLAAEGARIAESPAEVAAGCDLLLSCLPGPSDVERVYDARDHGRRLGRGLRAGPAGLRGDGPEPVPRRPGRRRSDGETGQPDDGRDLQPGRGRGAGPGGTKAGVDPELLVEIVSSSSGNSRSFGGMAPNILKRYFEPGFTIDLMHKDVSLAVAMARRLGVRVLAGALAEQVIQEARGAGLGDRATYALVQPLERVAGVEVKGS